MNAEPAVIIIKRGRAIHACDCDHQINPFPKPKPWDYAYTMGNSVESLDLRVLEEAKTIIMS